MTTRAFSGGRHSNKDVELAYMRDGWPGVFKVKGGIYDARDAGCRAFIDRFPGTRYGEPPHLTHFLRCADNGYVNVVKGLTGFSLFRKRCAWTVYLRGLGDLPQGGPMDRLFSTGVVRQIIAILRRAGAKAIVEGTPRNAFEWDMLHGLIASGVYSGTEPWWDRGATELFKYPSITEERALIAGMGGSVDGSVWPSTWRPFGKHDPAPMLLMSDQNPGALRDRIAHAESYGWRCVPYCHQWAAAQGVKP